MEDMYKVLVRIDDKSKGVATESFWAIKEKDGLYIIQNVPLYANGMSWGDKFLVRTINNLLYLDKKIAESGHSTYRIINLDTSQEKFDFFLDMLLNLKCTYEKGNDRLYALDVPIDADIFEAYKILELGAERDVWDFEEGHCSSIALKKYKSKEIK